MAKLIPVGRVVFPGNSDYPKDGDEVNVALLLPGGEWTHDFIVCDRTETPREVFESVNGGLKDKNIPWRLQEVDCKDDAFYAYLEPTEVTATATATSTPPSSPLPTPSKFNWEAKVDVRKLSPNVLSHLMEWVTDKIIEDLTDEEKEAIIRDKLSGLTVLEVMHIWLSYEGILGYADTIRNLLDNCVESGS